LASVSLPVQPVPGVMLRALRAQAQALCGPAQRCCAPVQAPRVPARLPDVLVQVPPVLVQVEPRAPALRQVGLGSVRSARFAQPEPDEPELPQQSVCQRQ
jgi:hypothetical protein